MPSLPLELVEEWMFFLKRETINACASLSRKLRAASLTNGFTTLRRHGPPFVALLELLEWADANNAYHELPRIDADALTEEMILYLCFGGRSTKRFNEDLHNPPVSPQFLRKLVEVCRLFCLNFEKEVVVLLRTFP